MSFIHGHTYRLFSVAYPSLALNVYGTNAASTGRNVCLYDKDENPNDPMQKWKYQEDSVGKRLHSYVNNGYVLDRSSGITNSAANNAHLCATGSTNGADSALYFVPVSGEENVYRIRLNSRVDGVWRFLTAANNNGTTPASSITTVSQLSSANKNVYWAEEATTVGSTAYNKQCWTVVDIDATSSGNTGGNTGDDLEGYDYVINDVGLPLDAYQKGSYWTNDGKATDASGSNSIVLNDGSKQCAGFAKYVYKILWGSYTAGRAVPTEITLRGVKSDFDSIGIGARINCRGDGPENHSMILLDKDDYGVTIYDANWDNKCGVDVRTYSYSDFATTMWRIKTTSYTP